MSQFVSEDDVASVPEALDPGSSAGPLVFENLWVATFGSAVRRAGGNSSRTPVSRFKLSSP